MFRDLTRLAALVLIVGAGCGGDGSQGAPASSDAADANADATDAVGTDAGRGDADATRVDAGPVDAPAWDGVVTLMTADRARAGYGTLRTTSTPQATTSTTIVDIPPMTRDLSASASATGSRATLTFAVVDEVRVLDWQPAEDLREAITTHFSVRFTLPGNEPFMLRSAVYVAQTERVVATLDQRAPQVFAPEQGGDIDIVGTYLVDNVGDGPQVALAVDTRAADGVYGAVATNGARSATGRLIVWDTSDLSVVDQQPSTDSLEALELPVRHTGGQLRAFPAGGWTLDLPGEPQQPDGGVLRITHVADGRYEASWWLRESALGGELVRSFPLDAERAIAVILTEAGAEQVVEVEATEGQEPVVRAFGGVPTPRGFCLSPDGTQLWLAAADGIHVFEAATLRRAGPGYVRSEAPTLDCAIFGRAP